MHLPREVWFGSSRAPCTGNRDLGQIAGSEVVMQLPRESSPAGNSREVDESVMVGRPLCNKKKDKSSQPAVTNEGINAETYGNLSLRGHGGHG